MYGNKVGLTWAERTDRDLYTHSDSDVFLKSNAAAPKVGGERVCAGTDIDDPWNSETESRTLILNKKSPLPKRKDSFEKRGRSSYKREPIKSSVTTATSSSTPSAPNGSPTSPSTAADTKKPLKNRAVVNTSGIAKYLGRDDKKVVLAKRDVEETNGKKGSPPPRTVWNIDAAPKSLPTRQRTLSGSTTDSTASTDRRTTFESSSAEPQSKGGRGRGRGGPRRGGASVAGRDTAHIPDTQDIVSLFVKNIPSSYSIQDIIDGFSPFGKVYDVRRLPHKGKRGEKIHYVKEFRRLALPYLV
uniref:RRM domain-containing protein n=1 Tax=Amphimedon queenslandica TaxID=400682 RepID=A0A1X7T6S0_AMPQE